MRLRYGIAIAGAHGKTTTTSMVALVLERAGLDPTAVIGGRLSAFGSNARLGRGEYMVAEADESDRSFLKLSPAIAVDHEHRSRAHGEPTAAGRRCSDAFVDFANKVPFYGAVDRLRRRRRRCAALLPRADAARDHLRPCRRVARRDVAGRDMQLEPFGVALHGRRRASTGSEVELGTLRLHVPGRHNLLNALGRGRGRPRARRAVRPHRRGARGVPRRRAALPGARRGARRDGRRRLRPPSDRDRRGDRRGARRRSTAAGRRVPAAPLHAHARAARRSSAPRSARADEVVLTDIYAAGEAPIPGVTVDGARRRGPRSGPLSAARRADARRPAGGAWPALARAGDLVDHARRRLDRRASATASSTALGERRCRRPEARHAR